MFAMVLPAVLGWADLRPRELEQADEADLAEREERGRALLAQTADAHGGGALAAFDTLSVQATDRWEAGGSWWPEDTQRFRADRAIGTFTSRVTLLGGPRDGEIWGLQDWQPYHDSEPVDADTAITFYLPTLQYFDELPWRILEAEHILDAGVSDSGHQRVFATWGSLSPHGDADQFVLYLDPETHRIDRVSYTVRDAKALAPWALRWLMPALAVGTMHLRDAREVGGVWFSFDQIVTLGDGENPRPPEERVFHRIEVHDIELGAVALDELALDPSRPLGDGSKPAE